MKQLEKELVNIYRSLLNKEFVARQMGEAAHPSYRLSAINLVRYITLRMLDLRMVHDHLSELGISSLRSCESYVMHNVINALKLVKLLNGSEWTPREELETIGYKASKKLLRKHTKQLFNSRKRDRFTRIMVTVPHEAAHEPLIIRELLESGMDLARIDLSKGSPDEWKATARHIRTQAELLEKDCKIHMDLAGPKLYTGPISIDRPGKTPRTFIKLKRGDHLVLTADLEVMNDSVYGSKGELLQYPSVSVSLESIVHDAAVGDRVYLDDGKIGAKVIKKRPREIEVVITEAREKGFKLRSGRQINLPDTKVQLSALTPTDRKSLPLVMEYADIVGFSYVRTVDDVRQLYEVLDTQPDKEVGVVLKIENQEAFENLPLLLLEAVKRPKMGVMIARGDLAVEVGPERIAEVQDQIMWICEAAHVPVIWATDVLDELAKTGKATRAEITDAAKSARAECVLLNDGPFVTEAVDMLSTILHKMEGHTNKKKSVMRALKVSAKNIDRMGTN